MQEPRPQRLYSPSSGVCPIISCPQIYSSIMIISSASTSSS
jgi:hypothetical protein